MAKPLRGFPARACPLGRKKNPPGSWDFGKIQILAAGAVEPHQFCWKFSFVVAPFT